MVTGMMVSRCSRSPWRWGKEYLEKRDCCEIEVLKQEETWAQCHVSNIPTCLLMAQERSFLRVRWKEKENLKYGICDLSDVGQWFSTKGDLCPAGHLALSGDILGCDNWGKGVI